MSPQRSPDDITKTQALFDPLEEDYVDHRLREWNEGQPLLGMGVLFCVGLFFVVCAVWMFVQNVTWGTYTYIDFGLVGVCMQCGSSLVLLWKFREYRIFVRLKVQLAERRAHRLRQHAAAASEPGEERS